MSYSDERKRHLSEYVREIGTIEQMGGHHKGGDRCYDHIIKVRTILDKKDQYQKVVSYNLLQGISSNMLKKEKLHPMAHYLTSSQMVCYNFFRPLIDKTGHPSDRFINMLKGKCKGIDVTSSAVCEFEYNAPEYGRDGRLEHTEFDFHIIDDSTGTEVFFEIKYTESEFGHWGHYASDFNYENFYHDMFKYSYAIKKDVPSLNEFSTKFQLYRNALRVRRPNQYSIFVFPKDNQGVLEEFNAFSSVIQHPENVFAWTWDELLIGQEDTEFYKKYFG